MPQQLAPTLRLLPLFIVMLLLVPGRLVGADLPRADRPPCLTVGWPQDESDLKPDPALVFGRLANGVRYVLMANQEPKNRVAMYLGVQAGSLHETEEQRGLAHFLEHMLFNGTTHYPPGTLVEYLQSLGMGFGGDTNARTSFDATVYNLLLPSAEPKVLSEGFKVLADYARGALLLEKEVDRERGVILAEKRSRDSAASRVSKRQLQFDFEGTLLARRDPIGVEEVLLTADSSRLRAYYDRWYRPDNMIVVVVGDMQPEQTVPLLTQAFAGLKGADVEVVCPEMGTVRETGIDILVLPEPELGYTGLALTTVFNVEPRPDTLERQVEQLRQYVGVTLLTNRLRQLEQRSGSPLAQPMAQAGIFLKRYGYATIAARTETAKWRESMTLVQTTLAQALRDGFTAAELDRGKREVAALLTKAVHTAPSRDSRQLADEIIRKLGDGEVIMNPAQEMAVFGPAVDKLTLAEVNDTFRSLWSRPRRTVHLVGNLEPGATGEQIEGQLRELYQANVAGPVDRWVAETRADFPYLKVPDPAEIVERTSHRDIGVESVQFAGGVRLQIKQTDYQANQVQLAVQFGSGRQAEALPGQGLVAEAVVRESGIGRLTRDQLTEALAGTTASLDFKAGHESFTFHGASLRQDFEILLQLLRHHLHDPAFRSEAHRRGRETLRRMYDQLAGTAEGVQQVEGERFLTGGATEYGLPSREDVERIDLEAISNWLLPIFSGAPLEINVVGDIDPQEAIRLVAKYFGGEERQWRETPQATAAAFPAGLQRRLHAASTIDRALLTVAWQTSDYWDIDRTRRLNLLAAVFDDRLRIKIREELGAAYAPRVISQPSRVREGFGLMRSSLIVDPEQAESLAGIIKKVAASLATTGIGEDELRRALEPTLTSIRDIRRTNRYWLESVLNHAGRHPEQLRWPLTILDGFAAIKAEELTELARRYLEPDRAATVIVGPQTDQSAPVSPEQR